MDCIKRDQDGKGCWSCFESGSGDCYFDSNRGKCIGREASMNPYYRNADQLTALIKEAESGYHWYHEKGGLWTCECEKAPNCLSNSPHFLCNSPVKCYEPKPYRGTKSEEVTWPGKDGETHQEALRELGLTDEACSEVASTYNEDKAALKEAGEDVLKEEIGEWEKKGYEKPLCMYCPITEHCAIKFIHTKYHNCMGDCEIAESYKKDSEESGDMKKKYIAKRNFSIWTLAKTDIAGETIKTLMLNEARTVWDLSAPFECEKCIPELLRLGFIEEKVEDPIVNPGNTFVSSDGLGLYRIMAHNGNMYTLCCIDGTSYFGPSYEIRTFTGIKLSFFVGKDRLKEFTPCKVKIVVEDELTEKPDKLTAAEAIYGFCGWLTCREEKTIMASNENAAAVPPLIDQFINENKLAQPRDGWENNLIHPKGECTGPTS